MSWVIRPSRCHRRLAPLAALFAVLCIAVAGCDTSAPSKSPAPSPLNTANPATVAGGDTPNIVIISIDTLRADHLGCYGYFRDTSPNMDAFAREAVFFEQAYAPMATTLPSHVSTFTGLYPFEHGVVANVGDGGKPFGLRPVIKSFAQIAATAGYATGGFVSATPLKRPSGFAAGFTTFDEPDGATAHRPGAATTRAALAWLDTVASKPFLLFVHYYDPHVPYSPPPEYQKLFTDEKELDAIIAARGLPERVEPAPCKGRIPTVTRTAINLYDGEIRYTDDNIHKVLDALRQRGLWDKTIIVVTADHGEGLNQHEWPQHGRIWNEQLHVPLMIHFPERMAAPPRKVSSLVSLVDVIPTLLGRFPSPWADDFRKQATGVDVLAAGFQERPLLAQRSGRKCPGDAGGLLAIATPRWRLLIGENGESELFSRSDDIHERKNLASQKPELAKALARLTRGAAGYLMTNGGRFGPERKPEELPAEFANQIAALGYVGGTGEAEIDIAEDETLAHFPTMDEARETIQPETP